MLTVSSTTVFSAISPSFPLLPNEEKIFRFVMETVNDIPSHPVVRVAGGFVRDKLLNINSKDIDLTVEGMKGIEFAEYLKQSAIKRYGTGQKVIGTIKSTDARPEQIKKLGVAFLRIYGQAVEILSLRGKETYEKGNRNPVSTSTQVTPQDDAFRRDLTINAMFYNLSTGKIEDLTGCGYDDLATMTLRTPLDPKQTFTDDPLRVLRVLRFYSRYPKAQIVPEVVEAMKDPEVQFQIVRKIHNPQDTMGIVTDRTAEELRLLFKGSKPDAAIRVMHQTGLLGKMLNLPANFEPYDMDQMNPYHSLNLIDHTLLVLKNVNALCGEFGFDDNQRMMMNIAALMHDLGKLDPRSHKYKSPDRRGYAGDPKNPNHLSHQQSSADIWKQFSGALGMTIEEQAFIHDVVLNHMNPHGHVEDAGEASDKQLRKYIRKNPSWVFQYVHAMADSMSKSQETDPSVAQPYRNNLERLRQLAPTADNFGRTPPGQDLLNGKDIMGLVGLPAKPPPGQVGYIEVIKERIRDEQDANPGFTRDDAINLVNVMKTDGSLKVYQDEATRLRNFQFPR